MKVKCPTNRRSNDMIILYPQCPGCANALEAISEGEYYCRKCDERVMFVFLPGKAISGPTPAAA